MEDSNPCHEFDSIFIEYYPDYNSTKSYAMESYPTFERQHGQCQWSKRYQPLMPPILLIKIWIPTISTKSRDFRRTSIYHASYYLLLHNFGFSRSQNTQHRSSVPPATYAVNLNKFAIPSPPPCCHVVATSQQAAQL